MTWLDEYTKALDVRDAREHADIRYINLCTNHADKRAALESALQEALSSKEQASTSTPALRPGTPKNKKAAQTLDVGSPGGERLGQLQADLAAAQKSRAELAASLKSTTATLEQLQLQSQTEQRDKNDAVRRATTAERRLRDRDEELRVKAKLLQDVQDEHVSLELQLNIADEKASKLEKENKDLIERWMKRMGQEADEMNERHKFS